MSECTLCNRFHLLGENALILRGTFCFFIVDIRQRKRSKKPSTYICMLRARLLQRGRHFYSWPYKDKLRHTFTHKWICVCRHGSQYMVCVTRCALIEIRLSASMCVCVEIIINLGGVLQRPCIQHLLHIHNVVIHVFVWWVCEIHAAYEKWKVLFSSIDEKWPFFESYLDKIISRMFLFRFTAPPYVFRL